MKSTITGILVAAIGVHFRNAPLNDSLRESSSSGDTRPAVGPDEAPRPGTARESSRVEVLVLPVMFARLDTGVGVWRRLAMSVFAIGALGLWACDPPPRSPQPSDWSTQDSAGVTLVYNHPESVSRGCVTIARKPGITIGAEAGNDRVPVLFRVRGGAVLSDGRIAILNAGSHELLFFAPDGAYQYAVGGEGRGPEEFTDPRWLGRGGADSLFVWDPRLLRLSTFDGAGERLASRQVGMDAGDGVPPTIGGRFTDGSFFAPPGDLVFFSGETGVTRFPKTYRRYDPETEQTSRLAEGSGTELMVDPPNPIYELPFGKTYIATAHGDALLVGDNGASAIRFYDMSGRLRRIATWESEAVPVTAKDRRGFARFAQTAFPDHARPPADARFADDRPRFSKIRGDRSGWIWVRKFAAEWEPAVAPWLVFDQDGVLRCEVNDPGVGSVLEIGEHYVLSVQRDELGVESVALFSITRREPAVDGS